ARHFAGAIGSAAKAAVSGKTDKIMNLLPFILIGIELYQDEEAFGFIMAAIESEEDLWTWVDYFASLAEINGGLETASSSMTSGYETLYAGFNLQALIPQAHAKGFDRKQVATLIIQHLKKLARNVGNPKKFSGDLKVLLKHIKENGPELKRFLNSKTFIAGTAAIANYGRAKLERFLKDSKNW